MMDKVPTDGDNMHVEEHALPVADSVSVAELADYTGIPRSTVYYLVDRDVLHGVQLHANIKKRSSYRIPVKYKQILCHAQKLTATGKTLPQAIQIIEGMSKINYRIVRLLQIILTLLNKPLDDSMSHEDKVAALMGAVEQLEAHYLDNIVDALTPAERLALQRGFRGHFAPNQSTNGNVSTNPEFDSASQKLGKLIVYAVGLDGADGASEDET